ncbi:response regulator [Patescibacteria group bacterium]|nr:response regulator [Patescibacteria group bacterium]
MAKILTVDDSAFMRKVLSDILTKNGHSVIEAENGVQALEVYTEQKPDLVLLDIIMPEEDGISVLKKITPLGAKAIIISAVGQDDMIQQAKTSGALDYIVKPFEETAVIATINKYLGVNTTTIV